MRKLLVLCALPVICLAVAFAGSGNVTTTSIVNNGGSPTTYNVDMADTSGISVNDHFGARTGSVTGPGGIWKVTAVVDSDTITVEDSLTEENGAEFGAPIAGSSWYATPTTTGTLSKPPFQAGEAWDAAIRRNMQIVEDNSVAGLSGTRGDVVYFGASGWQVLNVGTSGQVVRSNGTDPAWSAIQAGDLPGDLDDIANITTAARGQFLYWNGSSWTQLTLGTNGQVLTSNGTDAVWAADAHNLLSARHGDTSAGTVTRGSIIYGDATPNWAELVLGSSGQVLRSDGTDAAWSAIQAGDLPGDLADIANITTAVEGMLLCYNGDSWTLVPQGSNGQVLHYNDAVEPGVQWDTDDTGGGSNHNVLSSTHTDSTTATVVRGDLIVGITGPLWDRLALGTNGQVLTSDGTDVTWASPASSTNQLLDASNHTDTTNSSATKGDLIIATGTPEWDDLAVGNEGQTLAVVSSATHGVAWITSVQFPTQPGGRLTLSATDAVSTSDLTDQNTLYYLPHTTDVVTLWNDGWGLYHIGESGISLSNAGLANDTIYDVFLENSAGVLTLSTLAWNSSDAGNSNRAQELSRHWGMWVRTGDEAKLYLGTIMTDSAGNDFEDSEQNRFVWNAYNRVARPVSRVETDNNWTYTTASWRQANGQGDNEVRVVRGLDLDSVEITVLGFTYNGTGAIQTFVGVGLNNTTQVHQSATQATTDNNTLYRSCQAKYVGYPGIGYQEIWWLERVQTASGTVTWGGSHFESGRASSGITGTVWQ